MYLIKVSLVVVSYSIELNTHFDKHLEKKIQRDINNFFNRRNTVTKDCRVRVTAPVKLSQYINNLQTTSGEIYRSGY